MIDEKRLLTVLNLWKENSENEDWLRAISCVIDHIRYAPKIGEWIPVSERLPEKEGAYLLTVKTASGIRYVRMGLLYSNGKFADRNVIAWMPFPPPYQEGEQYEII